MKKTLFYVVPMAFAAITMVILYLVIVPQFQKTLDEYVDCKNKAKYGSGECGGKLFVMFIVPTILSLMLILYLLWNLWKVFYYHNKWDLEWENVLDSPWAFNRDERACTAFMDALTNTRKNAGKTGS